MESNVFRNKLATKFVSPATQLSYQTAPQLRRKAFIKQLLREQYPALTFQKTIVPSKIDSSTIDKFVEFIRTTKTEQGLIVQLDGGTNLAIPLYKLLYKDVPLFFSAARERFTFENPIDAEMFVGKVGDDEYILGMRAEWLSKILFLLPRTKIVCMILPETFNLDFFRGVLGSEYIYFCQNYNQSIFLNIYKV